jgi:hypothetical protein
MLNLFGKRSMLLKSSKKGLAVRNTDYVITDMIPELATMLIKEDMGACGKKARQILQESARLGETLHEDA